MENEKKGTYLFGFEESYGCLIGTHARDKDAIVAVMALCEAAAYYKTKDMTLWDAMLDLYERCGYYKDDIKSVGLAGIEGLQKIQQIMASLRQQEPREIAGCKVLNTAYDLWGTNWANANWSEVYTGLQTGTYDGQENPLPTADGASIQEVNKYCANWTGIYDCIFFTMNKELFDSLPADLQKTVLECGAKAAENQRKLQREGVDQVIEKWKAAGVTVTELSDEAVAEFKAATAPMYTDPEIVELLTADLITAFTK
jgi:hypothetical protein